MTGKLDSPGGFSSVHLARASSSTRNVLVVLGCLLLAACGGGGGSGSDDSANASMSLSLQNVSVSATTTQQAPTATVQVYVANLGLSTKVYIAPKYTDNGIVGASVDTGGTLPAPVSIQFKSPASLGPGTYNDTVTIYVCFDSACSHPVNDSPQTVQVQYTITKSPFTVTSLSPSSAYVGTQGFTLTVNGAAFTQASSVLWNGNSIPTTYISSSQLAAQVPSTDITATGQASVSVSDPTYGTSNAETFVINPSPLTLTAISPASTNVGGPAFTLTMTGTSFTSQSQVIWNGNPQITTYVSATQLTAQIPAADITAPGSVDVSVQDPVYGDSNSETFAITVPTLALASVSPTTVAAGGPAFMVTALGTAFTGTSVVEWNGTALATTLISSTELVAQVPASDIAATGTSSVTVSDPNSPPGATDAQTVTVVRPSIDATAFQMNPAHTGAVNFSSVSFPSAPTWSVNVGGMPSYALIADGEVIVTVELSVTSMNGGAEVLALDQATGKVLWGPVLVSGVPTAAYDNGRVFVLSGARISGATLQAFDANTGTLEWTKTLSEMAAWNGLPVAADGIVYVGSDGTVYALKEPDGALLWTGIVGGTNITAAVTVDGVYASYACQTSDFRPATGELVWGNNAGCSGGGSGMPVVANQLVYSDTGGSIFAAETGATEGIYAADSTPAFTATAGYFLQGGTLRGVTLSNDTVQWSFTGDGNLAGSPIAVNQYVFIGSSLGDLYALDGTTGKQVWTANLGTAIGADVNADQLFSGLAAGDGLLIVPAGNVVTAYTLSTNP